MSISIKDNILSYTLVHIRGKTRISNLIDGVKDIKLYLSGLASNAMERKRKPSVKDKIENDSFGKMFLKITFALFGCPQYINIHKAGFQMEISFM